MKNKQTSFSAPLKIERAEIEGNRGIVEGYFITFNSPAEYGNLGFYEMIAPEAIKDLDKKDIRCFYNHNYDLILGRQSNNTLLLTKDSLGLYGRCELNLNDSQALDVFERVKRGDITGCSFGAYINEEDVIEDDLGRTIYVVRDLDLIEVSVCPMPFYESTTMEARDKLVEQKLETKRLKRILEERYGIKSSGK